MHKILGIDYKYSPIQTNRDLKLSFPNHIAKHSDYNKEKTILIYDMNATKLPFHDNDKQTVQFVPSKQEKLIPMFEIRNSASAQAGTSFIYKPHTYSLAIKNIFINI